MTAPAPDDDTAADDTVEGLLAGARAGDRAAIDALVQRQYRELRRLAHARLRHRDHRVLLDTTGLVHESYLRLVQRSALAVRDRGHFMAYAAHAMRSVVVDLIREQQAARRGGDGPLLTLDTAAMNVAAAPADDAEVLALHEAMEALSRVDPRLTRVVEMRYFAGLSHAEIAEATGVSERTVKRDWDKARTFLFAALRRD